MFNNIRDQFQKELEEIRDAGMWKEEGVIEEPLEESDPCNSSSPNPF